MRSKRRCLHFRYRIYAPFYRGRHCRNCLFDYRDLVYAPMKKRRFYVDVVDENVSCEEIGKKDAKNNDKPSTTY